MTPLTIEYIQKNKMMFIKCGVNARAELLIDSLEYKYNIPGAQKNTP